MKKIHFQIEYQTRWGENLELVYSIDGLHSHAIRLHTIDGIIWETEVLVSDNACHIRHAYRVVNDKGNTLRNETNSWRIFYFNHRTEIMFCDAWANNSLPCYFHQSAFSKVIMAPRKSEKMHIGDLSSTCLLILHACPTNDGRQWAVVGDSETFGKWDVKRARLLQRTNTYEWALPLTRSDFEKDTQYKYILIDPLDPKRTEWEEGNNRKLSVNHLQSTTSIIRQDEMPIIHLRPWHGVGVVIPIFSLRSKGSFGIGDFGDLSLFIRWSADLGFEAIQLLPINDTTQEGTWNDSYPYNGISVFALHPIYIDAREWCYSNAYKKIEKEAITLNKFDDIEYEKVFKVKMLFLRYLYEEIGTSTIKTPSFKKFKSDNEYWLTPYTLFCTYRDLFKTANFRIWPHIKETDKKTFIIIKKEQYFYAFVQYLLHRQMQKVHCEARELGIILKGDIPIGVSPNSVSAWICPQLFHFDGCAGAPPDDFATHGQNWGFPTYNWEEMAKDGYLWWRKRLSHMSNYFDAYRIDHVLGFFRIWEIPIQHKDGVLGHFRPALPMSEKEIQEFGFTADIEKYTHPFINKIYLEKLQNKYGKDIKDKFFEKFKDGFTLKKEFLSQRAIERSVKDEDLCHTLLNIVCEVLFISDSERKSYFHPRIAGQHTYIYKELDDKNRNAFDLIHNHFFYNRHNYFWAEEAMKKIPVITHNCDNENNQLSLFPLNGNGMLPCAEDLGMVPESVKDVLNRFNILSLEIQRMPKEYGVQFTNVEKNPYLSVATIATHDMPPFRLWWKGNRKRAVDFWHKVLKHTGEPPLDATPQICEEVVRQHVHSSSMLCLLALQDWLSLSESLRSPNFEKEQINVPANPHQHWSYRMHLTIEKLIQSTDFNEKVRGIILSK